MKLIQRFQVSIASFLIIFTLSASDSFAQKRKPNRKQKKQHTTQPIPRPAPQLPPAPSVTTDDTRPLDPKDVPCVDDHGNTLDINVEQVLLWKKTTKNQFLARAHIKGVVRVVYPDRNGHDHFQAVIGKNADETIEVIYNESFGALPQVVPGMTVEACGDYITSNAATPQYAPSPDGAIIHWIHRSNNPERHKHGFVSLNGKMYGLGSGARH